MDIAFIILIAIVSLAFIGLIVGLAKGFTKVKSWANEYVLSAVLAILLGNVIADGMDTVAGGITVLCITAGLLLVFMLLSAWVRASLKKHRENRQKLSYYKQYNAMVENDENMADAIEDGNRRKYKKLSRRKFKRSGGVWTFFDKILGGITVALKVTVVTGLITACVLVMADLLQIDLLTSAFSGVYASGAWEFFKQYVMDFIVVGLLLLCIKCGFSSGVSNALWSLLVICMVVGAGVCAYNLAFNTASFASAAEGLDNSLVSGWFGDLGSAEGLISSLTVSKIILAVGVFLMLLVVIILLSVFVPRLINGARQSNVYYVVDGIFGAVLACAIVLGVLMLLGCVLSPISDLEFMEGFTAYFDHSSIATCFYTDNLLTGVVNLPIRDWLS